MFLYIAVFPPTYRSSAAPAHISSKSLKQNFQESRKRFIGSRPHCFSLGSGLQFRPLLAVKNHLFTCLHYKYMILLPSLLITPTDSKIRYVGKQSLWMSGNNRGKGYRHTESCCRWLKGPQCSATTAREKEDAPWLHRLQ